MAFNVCQKLAVFLCQNRSNFSTQPNQFTLSNSTVVAHRDHKLVKFITIIFLAHNEGVSSITTMYSTSQLDRKIHVHLKTFISIKITLHTV